jgi:pantothenate kinase
MTFQFREWNTKLECENYKTKFLNEKQNLADIRLRLTPLVNDVTKRVTAVTFYKVTTMTVTAVIY